MLKKVKSMLLVVAAMFTTMACSSGQPDQLHITGVLEGTGDSVMVMVVDMTAQKYALQKSYAVKDGKIDITIPLKEVAPVYLISNKTNAEPNRVMIYGVPGEECQLSGSFEKEYFVDGSSFYQQYNKLDKALSPIQREGVNIIESCQKMMKDGANQDSVMAYFRQKMEPVQQKLLSAQEDYIRQHPKDEACATLFADLPIEKVREMYALLDDGVKNGRMKPLLNMILSQADQEMNSQEQAKNIAEGKPAPDFTLKDIKGKDLSLSSLKGKYVILDFWGSWCVWCIKGFPEMKKYYQKYKGKFEILGIDCNDSEDKWKAAVAEHQLPWLHVYCPNDSEVLAKYAIQGFPTKIVVDPQGNIAKVIVGEDPAFYTYLDSIFK